jgi:hypothetical protein
MREREQDHSSLGRFELTDETTASTGGTCANTGAV